jgi:multidrug transporter EmrE-like cation transporter
MVNWIPYAFIGSIVGIEAIGDYHLAQFAMAGVLSSLIIGYLAYGITLILFIYSIREMGLAWSNSAWDGFSNIITNAVAILFLGEKATVTEYFGMALISSGLLLLGNKGTKGIKA